MKFAIPVIALGLLLSSTAFAKEDEKNSNDDSRGVGSAVTASERKVCLTTAKTTRVAAVKAASDIAKAGRANARTTRETALSSAKTTRDAAVTAAKANTDKTAARTAIKAANAAYKTVVKSTNVDYKASLKSIIATQAASVKTAWSNYTTAVKACPAK